MVIGMHIYQQYYSILIYSLDSILVNSNNKPNSHIFLEKCLYATNKKVLLGKYIDKSNS